MHKLSIELSDINTEHEGAFVAVGVLRIGDFVEQFEASLSYWDRETYLSQWRDALLRLLNGEKKSAIVTSMHDPITANFIFWWVMYLVDEIVYVQNHVLFLDELGQPFNENKLYQFIPTRETQTEEGDAISEWCLDINDVEQCVKMFPVRSE
jgi:hypothetical protein